MRQFNTPPGWPDPPTARWRPPRRWRPPATWPKPPRGWSFWVDENGRALRGPIGRYGGPGIVMTAAIVLIPLVLMAVVIVNPFRSGESVTTVPTIATSSTRPKAHATTAATTAPTQGTETPSPLAEQTTTTSTPTATPTATPTTVTPEPTSPSTPVVTPSAPVVPVTAAPSPTSSVAPKNAPTPAPSTSTVVFKNCDEVRAAGKAPLYRGDPGYSPALDHNGDGVACGDRGNS